MIRRPPRSTQSRSSAASDVYKRQNLPVPGAYRGYGATQGYAALECTIDDLAAKLGMDPIELRKMNMIRVGEGSPIFEALGEGRQGVAQTIKSSSLPTLIDLGAEAIGWTEKRGK